MTDIMERLRALSVTVEDAREAADEIERLRTELIKERNAHQATLDEASQAAETYSDELAAAQAREAMWRQAFETSRDAILHNRGALEEGLDSDSTNAVLSELDDAFSPVLDLPHDRAALNERLKAERERIAAMLGGFPITNDTLIRIREAIRNLGGEA